MNLVIISQIVQVVISILLVFLTLIQSKSQGLSSTLSGSFNLYRSRRGIEKGIFGMTIFLGLALVANSLFLIILK